MTCLICKKKKSRVSFQGNSPICISCVEELKNRNNVTYSIPERVTVKESYIRLVGAIRRQAEIDNKLDEWSDYWLREKEWKLVWLLIQESNSHFLDETRMLSVL